MIKITIITDPEKPLTEVERYAVACKLLTAPEIRRLCTGIRAKQIAKRLGLGDFRTEALAASAIEAFYKETDA